MLHHVRMHDTRPEIRTVDSLKRYSVTLPPELVDDAEEVMRARYVRSFSDYLTRLMQEDLQRSKERKEAQAAATRD